MTFLKMTAVGAIAICASFSADLSKAATLTLNSTATASGGQRVDTEVSAQNETALFLSENLQTSSGGTTAGGPATASAVSSIDARTGEMKFALSGSRNAINCNAANCGANFRADSLTRIVEEITVTGNGTLSMFMLVDANWSSPEYAFDAFVDIFPVVSNDPNKSLSFSSNAPIASGVSRLLFDSFNINSATGTNLTLTWGMQGVISGESVSGAPIANVSGFLDASNTATIFYEVSSGLTVSGGTAGFLSNPAYTSGTGGPGVSVVPVPASLPLLLAGLLGLFAAGPLRKRKAV